jgi:hypothetical protein
MRIQLSEVLDTLRNEFTNRIERKTGWGKNEVRHVFDDAVVSLMIYITGDPEVETEDIK